MRFRPTAFLRGAILATALAGTVLCPPTAAHAQQQGPAIAAVVNDQIISTYDLQSRMRLALLSANLEATPENQQRLAPQVLRQLVDERLQMQEAQRLNISVTEKDLADAVAVIERQNNLQPGQLGAHMAQNGVPISTLMAQLRANIAWGKVIRRQIRPQVEIGEEEIDDFLNDLRARGGRTEYEVAEILLSAESFDNPQTALQTASRLAEQARSGATFGALAQQFSQSPSAANGGNLGKVQEGQLDPRLEAVLQSLQPGQVSDPIPVENGYYILKLNNRTRVERGGSGEPVLTLRRVFLPVPADATPEEVAAQEEAASRVSDTAKSCTDMERFARELESPGPADPGPVRPSGLPDNLREFLVDRPIGETTPPLRLNDGFLIAMVCSRAEGGDAALPSRAEVMQSLGMQRIDMMARRYLRDLRRAAFVDVRL